MRFSCLCLLIFLFSCSNKFLDQGEKIFTGKLNDSTELGLTYIGGLSTTISSIWVTKKQGNYEEVIIDRIDAVYPKESIVKFHQINDSLVKLILIDSKMGNRSDSFLPNLNRKILPNDGYFGASSMGN